MGRRSIHRKRQLDSILVAPARPHPVSSPALLRLQQTMGNGAVGRLIQTKLAVSQPGDPSEVQADQLAGVVMKSPNARVAATPSAQQSGVNTSSPSVAAGLDSIRSGGRPLPTGLLSFFEPRLGHDLGQVRIHNDAAAAEEADAVNARAFTVGSDVVFAGGQYSPESSEGKRLLAHELVHVVQQRTAGTGSLQRTPAFTACKTKTKGKENEREELILTAITSAKNLAIRALAVMKKDFPLSFERKSISANFGSLTSGQTATIVERYTNIRDTLDSKQITCKTKCPTKKKDTHMCAQGEFPGTKIYICPRFGIGGCEIGSTLLHEAAHNAGAGDDIDKGAGYPPSKGENNAYSYENFPVDLLKPEPEFQLAPKTDREVPVLEWH